MVCRCRHTRGRRGAGRLPLSLVSGGETGRHWRKQRRPWRPFPKVLGEAADDELSGLYARLNLDEGADAAQEEAHLEEIKTIERAVEAAREGGTVEQLRAEYRRARTQLADDRDRDYDRAVGKVIADLVQEKTRDRGLPPVFHRARDLFADITNDRYELTLDRKTGTFRAYDHVYDDSFSLDGLERLFERLQGETPSRSGA